MTFSLLSHLAFAAQLSLGIVFLLSVWPKWRHPLVFARNVVNYKSLPTTVAYIFAFVLIPLETFLVIAFLTGLLTDVALLLATLLLVVFLVAVGINLKRERKITCGCFGDASEQISSRTLARLFLLLTVALLLVVFKSTEETPLPTLPSMTADISMSIYLLQTASLAAFFILLGAWLLHLPELITFVYHWRQIQSSSGQIIND